MKVQMHFIDWNLVKVYTNSAMHFVAIHQYMPSCRLWPIGGGTETGKWLLLLLWKLNILYDQKNTSKVLGKYTDLCVLVLHVHDVHILSLAHDPWQSFADRVLVQ